MRKFTIAHLSDLHLKGKKDQSFEVLRSALISSLVNCVNPKILLITGDTVDAPSYEALLAAKSFVEAVRGEFDQMYIIPGNHDVKNFAGSFNRSQEFNKVFNTKEHLLLRDVGLHLIGVDSTAAEFARGKITQQEYDSLLKHYYNVENEHLPTQEKKGLLRIVAVHHHPLPIAEGEDKKILHVIKDENLMYLESPAKFLEACYSYNVSLILHGHRHVQGLTRYSIQSTNLLTSNDDIGTEYDESWQTVYVLSCPSSTGKDCDAGFNILEFNLSETAAYVDISRLSRKNNQGSFKAIDTLRPNKKIRLLFSKSLVRDYAVDIEAALSVLAKKNAPEQELYPLIERLFTRRAFMILPERNWGQLYFATMKTRLIWQNSVIPKLREKREINAASVLDTLIKLEEFVGYKVLDLSTEEPDTLRINFIDNKSQFLKQLPAVNHKPDSESHRQEILLKLKEQLNSMGVKVPSLGAPVTENGEE